jgi:hypothetical protein
MAYSDNFGYDRDSHSGRQIHKAVLKERKSINSMYSQEELNKLSEIQ